MSSFGKSGVRIRVFGLPSATHPGGTEVDATGVFGSVRLDHLPTREEAIGLASGQFASVADALGASESNLFAPDPPLTPSRNRARSVDNHFPASFQSSAIRPLSLGELLDHPQLTANTAHGHVRQHSGVPWQAPSFQRQPSLQRQPSQSHCGTPQFPSQLPSNFPDNFSLNSRLPQPSPLQTPSPSFGPLNTGGGRPAPPSPSGRPASPSPTGTPGPSPAGSPSRLWIQVSNLSSSAASAEVLRQIGAHFMIHPVTVSDLQSDDSREKLEVFAHYLFVVIHSAVLPTPTIDDIVQQEEEEIASAKLAEEQGEPGLRRRHVIGSASSLQYSVPAKPIMFSEENPFVNGRSSPMSSMSRVNSRSSPILDPRLSSRASTGSSLVSESPEFTRRAHTGIFRAAGLKTTPIQLVVFPNLAISFHHGDAQSEMNSVCKRLDQLADTRMDTGQWLMHAMLDVVTSTLRPVVDDVERSVDSLEELIYALAGEEYADLLKRMGLTRRRLVALKQQLKSKQSILNSLIGRDWQSIAASVQTPYLRDVYDHTDTMLVKVECASEVLTALQDTYLANVQLRSERMSQDVNDLMKKFSAVATIILPLSLISGIMGMNVVVPSNIDKSNSWSDLGPFMTIIGAMIFITLIATVYFKRRGYM